MYWVIISEFILNQLVVYVVIFYAFFGSRNSLYKLSSTFVLCLIQLLKSASATKKQNTNQTGRT